MAYEKKNGRLRPVSHPTLSNHRFPLSTPSRTSSSSRRRPRISALSVPSQSSSNYLMSSLPGSVAQERMRSIHLQTKRSHDPEPHALLGFLSRRKSTHWHHQQPALISGETCRFIVLRGGQEGAASVAWWVRYQRRWGKVGMDGMIVEGCREAVVGWVSRVGQS